jgi:hypothetical protein
MTTVAQRNRRQPPRRAPRPPGVRVRRQWSSTRRRAYRLVKRVRESFTRGYAGVEKTPRWRRTWRNKVGIALVTILGLLLLAWVGRAIWIVASGQPTEWPGWLNPDDACRNTGYSCGIASGVVMSFLTVSFAGAVFFWLRLGRVRRAVVRRARDEPRELVETAGTIIGHVVGRDELCNVLVDDLKDRVHRRPHVVLGGVGVGKTAVILELTKRLAEHGAVPVPIRLRDAEKSLDFSTLAQERFTRELRRVARSDADAERAWRDLRNADQIVVLADGLEEALPEGGGDDSSGGESGSTERDNQIRVGFRAAQREHLPLVVASRPHDALVGLDAAVVELEPLGEESALEYIETGASTHDQHRLDWVIETADVTETPLFLQLARELHAVGLLENALPDSDDDRFDTRGQDRIGLRVRLLETWIRALEDGYFHRDIPFSRDLRRATIAQLGVLACAGLVNDSVEVRFADVFEPAAGEPPEGDEAAQPDDRCRYPALVNALRTAIHRLYDSPEFVGRKASGDHVIFRELHLAATRGVRLRLAEARGHGVRFPHSIMQAYLASRVLPDVLSHPRGDYLQVALKAPNRELLAALTMQTRALRRPGSATDDVVTRSGVEIVRALTAAAKRQVAADKAIDVVIAAMEVDCVQDDCSHTALAKQLKQVWPAESEDRTVEDAKLKAVRRFGEVARKIGERARLEKRADLQPAYAALYEIACKDLWYPVRIAAAQELGRGRDEVFGQLGGDNPLVRLGPFLESDLAEPARRTPDGGNRRNQLPSRYDATGWQTHEGHRELAVRAWVAPMFVSSVKECKHAAHDNLETWLRYVRADDDGRASRLPISLEIALAQGFKHAANRRLGRSRVENEARGYLAERAVEMLEHARFWFSRLTLIHALCLWVLSDPELMHQRVASPGDGSRLRRRRGSEPERRGSDPAALLDHWLASAHGGREHPFVAEARDLAVLALEKRQPERYIWIDESGVVSKIGSRPPPPGARRKHNLWIPPSTGWSALHPRAQRLVADVLILLNLIERGDLPVARERRLRRALRDDLPSCLAGTRAYLDPKKTVGTVEIPPPGARCKDGCAFDLCPYPAKGPSQTYRVELSEAFCRRQQVLIGARPWPFHSRTAPWQGAVPSELKRFWMEMETRARL